MKNSFFYIFICIILITAPKAFAQTDSNSDFNPFPQMEQDQQNVDSDTAPKPEEQNEDAWPPANADTQVNNGGHNE